MPDSRWKLVSIHALREEGDPVDDAGELQDDISIHALREEGDGKDYTAKAMTGQFLSTPSARRATDAGGHGGLMGGISIHALRAEGDFLRIHSHTVMIYFYPRPPRGGRPPHTARNLMGYRISIHALREEGDMTSISSTGSSPNFYPRPPRGGRRDPEAAAYYAKKFLSTPSARRATCFWTSSTTSSKFLSTPSARRATHGHFPQFPSQVLFLSTPSARRATAAADGAAKVKGISIHALRKEGDVGATFFESHNARFLSTPSARRATVHALTVVVQRCDFYPRPPRGGRPLQLIRAGRRE